MPSNRSFSTPPRPRAALWRPRHRRRRTGRCACGPSWRRIRPRPGPGEAPVPSSASPPAIASLRFEFPRSPGHARSCLATPGSTAPWPSRRPRFRERPSACRRHRGSWPRAAVPRTRRSRFHPGAAPAACTRNRWSRSLESCRRSSAARRLPAGPSWSSPGSEGRRLDTRDAAAGYTRREYATTP